MFVDRKKKKRRSRAMLFIVLIVSLASIGFLFNNESFHLLKGNNNIKNTDSNSNLAIPEELLTKHINIDESKQTIVPANRHVTPNTVLEFEIFFTMCEHKKLNKAIIASEEEYNMTKDQLAKKYPDWTIEYFSDEKIKFIKTIETYCPDHYIIGKKDDHIAVYKYTIDGQKVIFDETDIQLSTLTPEDQQMIQSGIVADNKDDLQLKLEGFSD